MSLFSFGQPDGGIIQTAFITADIERDMHNMTRQFGIGPWFLFENHQIGDLRYRGEPADFRIRVALGNCGHMQFELIQQLDDQPSVYRDRQRSHGYGFHHFAVGVRDFDAACQRAAAQGLALVLSGAAGADARMAYFDTSAVTQGLLEYIEITAGVEEFWRQVRDAALGWDGTEPIRRL